MITINNNARATGTGLRGGQPEWKRIEDAKRNAGFKIIGTDGASLGDNTTLSNIRIVNIGTGASFTDKQSQDDSSVTTSPLNNRGRNRSITEALQARGTSNEHPTGRQSEATPPSQQPQGNTEPAKKGGGGPGDGSGTKSSTGNKTGNRTDTNGKSIATPILGITTGVLAAGALVTNFTEMIKSEGLRKTATFLLTGGTVFSGVLFAASSMAGDKGDVFNTPHYYNPN